MKNIIVSISCITYNHEPYIRQCLDGFMMQETAFPFEVLIYDDASTDKTTDIIREYELKYPNIIKPIYQIENQYSKGVRGIMARFNFSRAQGKYIALCEGDDYWTDPLKLQKQVDLLEQDVDEKLVGVVTNASVCNQNGDVFQDKRNVVPNNKQGVYTLREFLKDEHLYPTLTLLFRNKRMDEVLEKMERLRNSFLGDWTLEVILLLYGDFYYLDEVTASYRKNPTSVTHTQNHVLRWKESFSICENVKKEIPSCYHKYLYIKSKGYWKLSFAYRRQKSYGRFAWYQLRAFVANPIDYFRRFIGVFRKETNRNY